MATDPVQNFQDLLQRFDDLLESAAKGPIEPEVVDYLRSTRTRMIRVRERTGEERRAAPRHPEAGTGRLVVAGKDHPVQILDGSETGFGLLSPVPVEPDTSVRLDIDDGREAEIYEALVIYCARKEEGQYHLGLDIFSSLHIG